MVTEFVPIPVEIAREIAREAEVRLGELLSMGTAADARATTLCGIFGGGSVALVAAVLAYLAAEHHAASIVSAGAVAAFLLFAAAVMAAIAAAPQDFWVAGAQPAALRNWAWDTGASRWRTEAEMLDSTAERLGKLIAADGKALEVGSRRVRYALWLAASSVPLGVIAYWAAACLS